MYGPIRWGPVAGDSVGDLSLCVVSEAFLILGRRNLAIFRPRLAGKLLNKFPVYIAWLPTSVVIVVPYARQYKGAFPKATSNRNWPFHTIAMTDCSAAVLIPYAASQYSNQIDTTYLYCSHDNNIIMPIPTIEYKIMNNTI